MISHPTTVTEYRVALVRIPQIHLATPASSHTLQAHHHTLHLPEQARLGLPRVIHRRQGATVM